MIEQAKDNIHETNWQLAFQNFVKHNNDFVTQNKKRTHILSLGTHNRQEGPDFLNACLQIDGKFIVGDVEFHKQSSCWMSHHHQDNPAYSNVVLHVVFEDNKKIDSDFETIIVSRLKLKEFLKNTKSKVLTTSSEDYKYYAMLRLFRRTEEIFQLLQKSSSSIAVFSSILEKFLVKYNNIKTYRTQEYNFDFLNTLLQKSILFKWLHSINKSKLNIEHFFYNFVNNTPTININKQLKQEILTNVVLPFSFCLATRKAKIELILWYWSARTRSKYGILGRIYPESEQKYIWQQQGMLEHHKEYYKLQTSSAMFFLKDCEISDYISYFELTQKPYYLRKKF